MTPKTVYGIEGLDRLGKSTLIEGIRNTLGYYEVIHFSKPQRLDAYRTTMPVNGVPHGGQGIYHYQHESFVNSMLLANSGARIIFDRWHLGEAVYSPMYRGYDGDYVFDIETRSCVDVNPSIRLILLVEDFDIARHFVDDGESLGAVDKREEEQQRFIDAFTRSGIRDKRTVCVTDPGLGGFKPKDWILAEALA
jgi:thymidylate kinase